MSEGDYARLDVLAANQLGNALFPANQCGATCLFDAASRKFYVDWDEIMESSAAALRASAAGEPFRRSRAPQVRRHSDS
ncbi:MULTISPECIES: MmyB family transcriptional regulator [Streptomyces]|uniref:MmyB family transcriptional regulator n=1 Tax=Streptomyces TaxID=1883 RepID=UPI0035A1A88F